MNKIEAKESLEVIRNMIEETKKATVYLRRHLIRSDGGLTLRDKPPPEQR